MGYLHHNIRLQLDLVLSALRYESSNDLPNSKNLGLKQWHLPLMLHLAAVQLSCTRRFCIPWSVLWKLTKYLSSIQRLYRIIVRSLKQLQQPAEIGMGLRPLKSHFMVATLAVLLLTVANGPKEFGQQTREESCTIIAMASRKSDRKKLSRILKTFGLKTRVSTKTALHDTRRSMDVLENGSSAYQFRRQVD